MAVIKLEGGGDTLAVLRGQVQTLRIPQWCLSRAAPKLVDRQTDGFHFPVVLGILTRTRLLNYQPSTTNH
jgi:hypothetical protein